jgi:membrane associated rhomboid family serine protease
MGLYDRDYARGSAGAPSHKPSRLTPVVKWLLIANAALFLIDYLVLPLATGRAEGAPPLLVEWGAFVPQEAMAGLRLWQFLSFQFLHDSLGHLLFNGIGLFFFGPWIERWWGSRRFTVFYLLCGIGGALLYSLLSATGVVPGGGHTGLIGASAGIYGIFIAVAVVAPDMRVMLLIPPIELSMRQLAIGLLAISAGLILTRLGGNEGGEAGHLGGAVAGFLLMKFPGLLSRIPAARAPRAPANAPALSRTQTAKEVDRILDKISAHGFQSLTEGEKDTLKHAAKHDKSPL